MAQVEHENFVKLWGICWDSSSLILVSELVEGNSLFELIHVKEYAQAYIALKQIEKSKIAL